MTSRRVILHEATQRSLCHLGFVTFGLAPLLLCVYLAIAACLPGYHQRQAAAWVKELEKSFGLSFRVGEAHSLAPFRFRLDNVEVLNPANQKLVGKISSVHLTEATSGRWNIRLDSPELQIDQIADSCKIIHQWYLSRGPSSLQQATIACEKLSISGHDSLFDLATLTVDTDSEANLGLTARFKILPSTAQKLTNVRSLPESMLVVKRHRATSEMESATTEMEWVVQEASPAPCLVLTKLLDLERSDVKMLNLLAIQSSQFSGKIRIAFNEQKTNYSLENAKISNIDMSRLSFGRETLVSGTAELSHLNIASNSRQLDRASGHIEISPGYMDSRFLRSLEFYLGFSMKRQLSMGLVGFNRTSMDFAIQPRVFQVIGRLDDTHGVLAMREDTSALPIISLVHALAFNPDNPMIPGTISPLVRQALVWLPLDETDRQQLASRQQYLR